MPIITILITDPKVVTIVLELFSKAKVRNTLSLKTHIEFSGQKAVTQLLNYLYKYPLQYKYSQQI